MRKLLFALLLFLSSNLFAAPQKDTVININSLPPTGVGSLLVKGWKFHTGDDPAFVRPDYDDRSWQSINPTVKRPMLPKAAQQGIGWLRLRFKLAPLLRKKILLQAMTSCAVEFYVDGKLIGNRGTIDPVLKTGHGHPDSDPLTLSLTSDSVHVLAVRYAHQANIQFLNGYLNDDFLSPHLTDTRGIIKWQATFEDFHVVMVVCMSVLLILALLHIVLLYYNPAQKANLYFGCYAFFAAVFAGTLFLTVYRFLDNDTYVYTNVLWVAALLVAHLWAVKALYTLFHFKQGKFYTFLVLIAAASMLIYTFVDIPPYPPALALLLAEGAELWLSIKAVSLKKRGALIIALGFLGGLVGNVCASYITIYSDINTNAYHHHHNGDISTKPGDRDVTIPVPRVCT